MFEELSETCFSCSQSGSCHIFLTVVRDLMVKFPSSKFSSDITIHWDSQGLESRIHWDIENREFFVFCHLWFGLKTEGPKSFCVGFLTGNPVFPSQIFRRNSSSKLLSTRCQERLKLLLQLRSHAQ